MLFPRQLTFQNRAILFSGRGRAPGAMAYMDPQQGTTLEVFHGNVVQSGPHFCLVEVVDNKALPAVRVDHATLNGDSIARAGDELILGPLVHSAQGPKAKAAWKVHPKLQPKPAPSCYSQKRFRGVIGNVAPSGTYGRIIDTQGNLVFVHRDQMRSGELHVGQHVSFLLGNEGRGPKAFDVKAVS